MPSLTRRAAHSCAAVLLACALTLLAALGLAAPSSATADEPPPVRWSATPADESGPDGRSVVEHSLDPGERVEDHLAVHNVSGAEVTFQLAAADGFYTRAGRFDMLASDEESVAAGTWITLPEAVTVAPGETEVVDFAIAVPENAEPGDHAAGVTASVLSVQEAQDGASVGVESRVGFRVTTRVTGELAPSAVVANVTPEYSVSWHALRPGDVTVAFDVRNEGNTRLFVEGVAEAGGQDAGFPADDSRQELLPGGTRTLAVPIDDVWPLFVVPVELTLVPEMVTVDGSVSTLDPVVVEAMVWAVPWPQLMILVGVALLVVALLWGRRRSRRRLDALLAEARAEGRRSSVEGVPAR